MTSTDNPASACAAEATQRICDEHIGRMLASETLREGSFDHDLLADLRDARAERDELRQRQRLLSDTFLAERDLDARFFRLHGGRRRNPDYNAGYRMGMEDAARYARGDFTPPGKNLEESIEKNLAMLPGDDA